MATLFLIRQRFTGSLCGPTALLFALGTIFGASCSKQNSMENVSSTDLVEVAETSKGATALLVVDVQNGFFGADIERINPGFRGKMAKLLSDCRRRGIEVIHIHSSFSADPARRLPTIQTIFGDDVPCVEGTADCKPMECAWSLSGEKVFLKDSFDPFLNPQLSTYLHQRGINHLLVCGLTTEVCVLTTCMSGTNRGYFMTLIEDCCVTGNQTTAQFVINKFKGMFFEGAKSYQIPAKLDVWKQRTKKSQFRQS